MLRSLLAASVLAALLAVGASGAAQPLPQVAVSRAPGTQAEVAITVDPANPAVLLAASNSITKGDLTAARHDLERVFASADGGATWTDDPAPQAVAANGRAKCNTGDPAVGIGPGGSQYLAFLGAPCDLFDDPQESDTAALSLQVAARDAAGAPWRVARVFPVRSLRTDDKPALIVEQAGPFTGRVYVVWTRFTVVGRGKARRGEARIVISHSDDGARSWSKPVAVNDGAKRIDTFGGVAVDRSGAVFVSWTDDTRAIYVDRAADGVGFGRDVRVARAAGRPGGNCRFAGLTIPAQAERCITPSPSVVVDDRAGIAERVYVTYAAPGFGGLQVDSLIAAFDGALRPLLGAPAGRAKLVHPADPRDDQFMPAVAVDDVGRVWVCYYDTAGAGKRRSTLYTCTASADGGVTFAAPVRAASVRSNETVSGASVFQYGDYQSLVVAGGVAHPIWTDSRNLRSSGEDIYTTVLTPALLGL